MIKMTCSGLRGSGFLWGLNQILVTLAHDGCSSGGLPRPKSKGCFLHLLSYEVYIIH